MAATETKLPRPPLVRGWPILGSALPMSSDPIGFLLAQYRTHGPVFRLKALHREITALVGTEANLFLTRDSHEHTSASSYWKGFGRSIGARELLPGLDGERHRKVRSFLKPGYARDAMVASFAGMLDVSDAALRALPVGKRVPVLGLIRRIVADQLGLVVVGRTSGDYFPDLVIFVNTLLNVEVVGRWPGVMLHRPRFRRARRRMIAFARDVVAARQRGDDPARVDDLVAAMLTARREDPGMFTENDVLLNVLGPLIAGLDTSSNVAVYAIYALLRDPALLARVTAEIDRVMAAAVPTLADLQSMTVLRSALQETLRRYPITPGLARIVTSSFEFAGHRIDAGAEILVATAVTQFMSELFPRPEVFDIERFSAPRNEHQQKGAFFPWGAGPHTCLGAGIAEIQIMLIVARLLHRAHLAIDPPDYQLKRFINPVLSPGNTFGVRITGWRN